MTARRSIIAAILGCVAAVAVWAADEVRVTGILKVKNGNFEYSRSENNYTHDQTTQRADMGIQSFGTATNGLNLVNITTPHYAWFRNLSTTTNITVTLTMKLQPNDFAIVPLANTNVDAYAEGGTVLLEYWVNEQ